MDYLDYFKGFGQRLRSAIYASLAEGKAKENIPLSTFNNKVIAISNQFLNSSKGSFKQFIENLARVIISHKISLSPDALNMINKENYQEIASIISLAVVSTLKKKNDEQNTNELPENEVSGDSEDAREL